MLGGALLLVLAATALAAAARRVVAPFAEAGLLRAVAAAPVAVGLAVAEVLLLGRLGWSGEPLVLAGAAGLTYAASRALRAPAGAAPPVAVGAGAVAGALLALTAWMLRHPALGVDGVVYHLTEVTQWVQAGNAGTTPHVSAEFPTGSYPLTNEAVLAWAMGLAHSFAPVALWMALVVALLLASGWAGLRELRVPPLPAGLALAALLAVPVALLQLNTPKNDLPALAWLACAAALCACAASRREPRLLAVALLAAGLAVGSKTTTALLAAVALGVALWAMWPARGRGVRGVEAALGIGLLGAAAAGGVWYLRNLAAHGSPVWPVPFGSVGDPVPPAIARLDVSFLERPADTLEGRVDLYVKQVGGGALLVLFALLAPLVARTRAVVLGAAATLVATLAWTVAPFTGRPDDALVDVSPTTLRYLLPAFGAAVVTLALAARTSRLATAALGAGLLASVLCWPDLGYPDVPSPLTPLLGAALGAGAVVAARRIETAPTRNSSVFVRSRCAAAAAVGAVVLLAAGGDGYLARHARAGATSHAPLEAAFARVPGWATSREPVALAPEVVGTLAGDRLRHRVELVPPGEPCAVTRRRAGYVVVRDTAPEVRRRLAPTRAFDCYAKLAPLARVGPFRVYRQTATRSSAASTPSSPKVKSSTPIAAARGSSSRRARVSSRS